MLKREKTAIMLIDDMIIEVHTRLKNIEAFMQQLSDDSDNYDTFLVLRHAQTIVKEISANCEKLATIWYAYFLTKVIEEKCSSKN